MFVFQTGANSKTQAGLQAYLDEFEGMKGGPAKNSYDFVKLYNRAMGAGSQMNAKDKKDLVKFAREVVHEAFERAYSENPNFQQLDNKEKYALGDDARADCKYFNMKETNKNYLEILFERNVRAMRELAVYANVSPGVAPLNLTDEKCSTMIGFFVAESFKSGRMGAAKTAVGGIFDRVFDYLGANVKARNMPEKEATKDYVLEKLGATGSTTALALAKKKYGGFGHPSESGFYPIVAAVSDIYDLLAKKFAITPAPVSPTKGNAFKQPKFDFREVPTPTVPMSNLSVSLRDKQQIGKKGIGIEVAARPSNLAGPLSQIDQQLGSDGSRALGGSLTDLQTSPKADIAKPFNDFVKGFKGTGGNFSLRNELISASNFNVNDLIRNPGERQRLLKYLYDNKLLDKPIDIVVGKNEYTFFFDKANATISLSTVRGQKITFDAHADNKLGLATAQLVVPFGTAYASANYTYDAASRTYALNDIAMEFSAGGQMALKLSGSNLGGVVLPVFHPGLTGWKDSSVTVNGKEYRLVDLSTDAKLRKKVVNEMLNSLGENAKVSIAGEVGKAGHTTFEGMVTFSKQDLTHGYKRVPGGGEVSVSEIRLHASGSKLDLGLQFTNNTLSLRSTASGTDATWTAEKDGKEYQILTVHSDMTKEEIMKNGAQDIVDLVKDESKALSNAFKTGNWKDVTSANKMKAEVLKSLTELRTKVLPGTSLDLNLSNVLRFAGGEPNAAAALSQMGTSSGVPEDLVLHLNGAQLEELGKLIGEGVKYSQMKVGKARDAKVLDFQNRLLNFFSTAVVGATPREFANLALSNYAGYTGKKLEDMNGQGLAIAAKRADEQLLRISELSATAATDVKLHEREVLLTLYGELALQQIGISPANLAANSDLLIGMNNIGVGAGMAISYNDIAKTGVSVEVGGFGKFIVPLGEIGLSADSDKTFIPLFKTTGKGSMYGFLWAKVTKEVGDQGKLEVGVVMVPGSYDKFGVTGPEAGKTSLVSGNLAVDTPKINIGFGTIQANGTLKAYNINQPTQSTFFTAGGVLQTGPVDFSYQHEAGNLPLGYRSTNKVGLGAAITDNLKAQVIVFNPTNDKLRQVGIELKFGI